MISLFRKIRKKLVDDNKPLSYMKYAIGEIALVVIGILIALQINSWDLQKQQQNDIKENAQDLKLITNDINEVNKVLNSLLRLQSYYHIRSESSCRMER